ncbi:hypothetical protein BH18ACT14_BH18ACT14_19930 [soil metagenome]
MTGRLVSAAVLAFAVSLLIAGSAVGLGPAVTITSPVAGSFVDDATPTVTGSASEASDVTVKIWSGNDTMVPPLASAPSAVAGGEWLLDLSELVDGPYTLIASQTDASATVGESAPQSFTVDTTNPTGSITAPVAAAIVRGLTAVSSDSADAGSGVQQVVFERSPAGFGTWTGIDTDTSAPYSVGWATGSLADGSYDLRAVTTDLAGNTRISATVNVVVDNAPARVVLLTARPGDHRVRLTWKNPSDSDFLRVVVRRGTGVVYQGRAEGLVDVGLFNGTVYTYRFTAVDFAGNISTTTSVRVRPRGSLLSPRDGGVIRVAPVLEWAKVTRATFYNVQLWRNGRKILSRWPTRPSYERRMRWRYGGRVRTLRDGTYLWYVWPGFGDRERGRYGGMLGSATFFKR